MLTRREALKAGVAAGFALAMPAAGLATEKPEYKFTVLYSQEDWEASRLYSRIQDHLATWETLGGDFRDPPEVLVLSQEQADLLPRIRRLFGEKALGGLDVVVVSGDLAERLWSSPGEILPLGRRTSHTLGVQSGMTLFPSWMDIHPSHPLHGKLISTAVLLS